MKKLRLRLQKTLNHQKVRFLLVGGFNTGFGYGMFILTNTIIGHYLGYVASLILAQIISASMAYVLFQRFVFTTAVRGVKSFLKFQSVYVVPLLANILVLPILVEVFNWQIYVAQAAFSAAWIVSSFFVHKKFSFSK